MELNYYVYLMKTINQTYLTLRMEADLPWSASGKKFCKQHLNVKTISEVEQLIIELKELDKAVQGLPVAYNQDLMTTFNAQFRLIELSFATLVRLHQEFKTWAISYTDQNLLQFQQYLLTTFQEHLEYLMLTYQNIFLKAEKSALIQYLSSLNEQFNNHHLDQNHLLVLISDFYFELNDRLKNFKSQNLTTDLLEQKFYLYLMNFSLKIKLLLSLYYHWLNNNQILDQTSIKYASFYA